MACWSQHGYCESIRSRPVSGRVSGNAASQKVWPSRALMAEGVAGRAAAT